MEKVLGILRENLQGEEFVVDHPRRTLEEYFLEVINQARAESVETSGVVGGGRIADYLSEEEKKDAVLDNLIAEPAAVAARPAAEAVPEVDKSELLNQLTEEPKTAPETPEIPVDAARAEELEKANEKLQDLLGKKQG